MQQTEHILLESDGYEVPQPGRAQKTHAELQCHSKLRRRGLNLAIVDYYYLAVRTAGAGLLREYVIDLRFADPSVRLTRHIPWRLIGSALALGSLAIFSAWRLGSSATSWKHHEWLLMCAATTALMVCMCLACAWRTTETLSVYSAHGRATLLAYTGGPGTLRTIHLFCRKLAAHIQLAVSARRSSKAEHLRDEMREHFRLKEAGVLSREQYEASKARILAHHTPVTPSQDN